MSPIFCTQFERETDDKCRKILSDVANECWRTCKSGFFPHEQHTHITHTHTHFRVSESVSECEYWSIDDPFSLQTWKPCIHRRAYSALFILTYLHLSAARWMNGRLLSNELIQYWFRNEKREMWQIPLPSFHLSNKSIASQGDFLFSRMIGKLSHTYPRPVPKYPLPVLQWMSTWVLLRKVKICPSCRHVGIYGLLVEMTASGSRLITI